ncbi:hypothetical protein LXL04_003326 [Taraxacum kok-saghyz]
MNVSVSGVYKAIPLDSTLFQSVSGEYTAIPVDSMTISIDFGDSTAIPVDSGDSTADLMARRKKGFCSKNAISQRKINFAEGALRNGGISQTLVAFRRACSAKLIDLLRNRLLTPVHRSDM